MNRFYLIASMLFMSLFLMAQNETDVYNFSVVKENPITSIKNQANSGTCWSFAGVGFLESELLRMDKGTHDLSEMYIVRRNYEDKAVKYARLHGSLNFGGGGSFADVIETLDEYGVIPDTDYKGLMYGEDNHKHGEVDNLLSVYMDGVVANKNRSLTPVWFRGYNGILDAYFGEKPASFQQNGKTYTPQSFATSLGLKSDNYISLSSFTHHEFYTEFAVEVPDNWRCCGFAGDRGMLHPELTASATSREAGDVADGDFDAYVSCNRTCEIGMSRATGHQYLHVLEVLDRAASPITNGQTHERV